MTSAQGATGWAVVPSRAIHLAPSLPFEIAFRLPWSRYFVQLGTQNLKRLRQRAQQPGANVNAYLTLARRLLSQQPLLHRDAQEAADALRTALELLPADSEVSTSGAYLSSMLHKLLGDAVLSLGQHAQARQHWQLAVARDPIGAPYGWSVPAKQMLELYPDEGGSDTSGVAAPLSGPPSPRSGRDAKPWPDVSDNNSHAP